MSHFFRFILFGFFLTLASSVWGFANGAALGVVYPEVREPYKKIFETIIGGIEYETGSKIDQYTFNPALGGTNLEAKISKNDNQVILALGLGGMNAVSQLDLGIPIIIGAILSSSVEGFDSIAGGISLMPDPGVLFEKLKLLVPTITTISVIYNPDINQALIDQAINSARNLNLTLDAHVATDIRQAALIYKELAENIDSRTNAIWLLQDSTTIDSDSVLPSLLEQAWKRRLIVFSSKLVHVKRGALFSMYPDNFKMGRELGKLATAVTEDSIPSAIYTLRALKIAVNMRTAKHLGIDFSSRDERSFDLVFPRP